MFNEALELTKKLVSIPSINTTSGEHDIAVFIEEYLRENYLKNIVYHIVESKVSDEKQVVEALENNKMARICICIR